MGKGSSGKKANSAAKKNRAMYVAQNRRELNKFRKAKKEDRKQAKLYLDGKGEYATGTVPPRIHMFATEIMKKRHARVSA